MAPQPSPTSPIEIFRQKGGMLRTSQALAAGIHPRDLYRLRDQGTIIEVTRGVFRLADLPDLSHPDLIAVALRVPSGVVCLVSALSFHGITTQVPHQVDVALPRRARSPRMVFPPVRTFTFAAESFSAGVEQYDLDGVKVPIYGAARTVVDCFKFRNRIGVDIAVEALRLARDRDAARVRDLLGFARLLRMDRVMAPYLGAVL